MNRINLNSQEQKKDKLFLYYYVSPEAQTINSQINSKNYWFAFIFGASVVFLVNLQQRIWSSFLITLKSHIVLQNRIINSV